MPKLCEEFKHFRGQPVEVITEDGSKYCGIDLNSDDESVTIIDHCSRVILIPYAHIVSVVEPQMRLNVLCKKIDCSCCGRDNDDDNGCNGGNGGSGGRYNQDCSCD